MKIAVTANGDSLDSELDPRFGRSPYFLLVDSETEEIKPIDNQRNLQAASGAGIQAAESVANAGAEVLLTGHCGPNAFQALKTAGVKVVLGVEGSIRSAIEKFKNGEYTFADSEDVRGHW